jgi:hypothetical protein
VAELNRRSKRVNSRAVLAALLRSLQAERKPNQENGTRQPDPVKSVVEFKKRFKYSSWSRYDLAVPGSFQLSPPDSQLPALERDYRAMRDMFFRETPTFKTILDGLAFELEINSEERVSY